MTLNLVKKTTDRIEITGKRKSKKNGLSSCSRAAQTLEANHPLLAGMHQRHDHCHLVLDQQCDLYVHVSSMLWQSDCPGKSHGSHPNEGRNLSNHLLNFHEILNL